jgi:hypothetical protein
VAERIGKRLKVLDGQDRRVVVPHKRFFTLGTPDVVEPYGEVLPLLSHVEDDLARYVISTAPNTSWGRLAPPPLVLSLPSRAIAPHDGIFLVTAHGANRVEPHPSGRGRLHLVYLGQTAPLWAPPARPWIYRLDAAQVGGR